jgi:hypothetical protein
MATAYTTSLKLALPTQGELTGAWGDVIKQPNNFYGRGSCCRSQNYRHLEQ